MKKNDIKDAFGALKADVSLKEKIMLRAEEDINSDDTPEFEIGEMSRIEIKEGGGTRKVANALLAMAAAVAVVFSLRFFIADNIEYPNEGGSEIITAVSEEEPLPPNTAEVNVKVVDENGIFVKSCRIDYAPIIPNENSALFPVEFDTDNIGRAGTIPMTYDEPAKIRLEYGTYWFELSDALPNDIAAYEPYEGIIFKGGSGNSGGMQIVTIDETSEEVVFTVYGEPAYKEYSRGIALQDFYGKPLQDWTVILKPVSGEMADGYSDIYGGYVLPRTDKSGASMWNYPIEGEYTIIAYKERLHTADVPISEPFIFATPNTFTYVKKESDFTFTTCEIYTQMPKEN